MSVVNNMQLPAHPRVDTDRARQIWAEYQHQHDLTDQKGRIAAIEPVSGGVWIGDDAIEIFDRMQSEGFAAPVYLIRVGYDYFVRKGRR